MYVTIIEFKWNNNNKYRRIIKGYVKDLYKNEIKKHCRIPTIE